MNVELNMHCVIHRIVAQLNLRDINTVACLLHCKSCHLRWELTISNLNNIFYIKFFYALN
jgi:hypothetical protein